MKRYSLLLLLVFSAVLTAMAQRTISGTIIDRDTKDGVMQATVSLLKSDSTFVKGVISDTNGKFSIAAPSNGKFILKITSVAYKTLFKPLTVSEGKDLPLGNVVLSADAIMLKEAVATGTASKVVVKADTFVYNAAAYHTPEGSVVEELVKRLPGAQVSDDGKITINGKEVKKIKVDGKEFMTGDTETALKNLPTSIIDRIRAYDDKSDLSRITGIDDGNDETVLDFGIKRGMNKGLMSNSDFGIGTQDRYYARTFLSYMKDDWRVVGMGNAMNAGGGFGGYGGGRGGGNGLQASKMLSANFNYEKKDTLKIDGSVRWNHSDGDSWRKTASERYSGDRSNFSNDRTQSFSRGDRLNFQMRLEWTPDSMTNLMFRPSVSTNKNDGRGWGNGFSFNADPYSRGGDPFSISDPKKFYEGILTNMTSNSNLSYSENNQYNAMLQFNRKLGSKGRNFTLRFDGSYSEGQQYSSSLEHTLYPAGQSLLDLAHMTEILLTEDSTLNIVRYNSTPTKRYNLSGQMTYSEPIAKALFLQLSYTFRYERNKSDRDTYDFLNNNIFENWTPTYREWDIFRDNNPQLNENLSRYSQYDTYTHSLEIMIRKITEKYNLSAGVMVQPQHTAFMQNYQGLKADTTRNVINFSPSLDFRYKFNQVSQLQVTYRGTSQQPSMTDLLDITDDSHPNSITKGNPGLKPSFTQRMNLRYNTYKQAHTQSFMIFGNFSTTRNSVSNKVQYLDGGRTITTPENINGNWNASSGMMYSFSVDSTGVWNVNTFTMLNYSNHVSYLDQNKESVKNTTHNTTILERLGFSYRTMWLEIEPNGMVNYSKATNLLQPRNNTEYWGFNYGLNININAPWGTGFSTDAHVNSRRGYSDPSLNTNEFVWNAQISQSFLKGRPLTISLQYFDILHNQTNFSRAINAMGRTDTENNNLNSYAMLHVIYRFNSFGGKAARQGMMGGMPDFSDPRFNRGGMGGGRPGGQGGGRPGGQGGRPGGFGGGFGGGRF